MAAFLSGDAATGMRRRSAPPTRSTGHHSTEEYNLNSTIRSNRRDERERPAPAHRTKRRSTASSRCACVQSDGTPAAGLTHLAPLRDGVDGIID